MKQTDHWHETFLTCMHGVTEGVDHFDCPKCMKICEKRDCPCVEHNRLQKREVNKIKHLYGREPDDNSGE